MEKKIFEWLVIENELKRAEEYPGFAFQVWRSQTLAKLSKEMDIVRTAGMPNAEYQKLIDQAEKKKQELCIRDEQGEPVIANEGESRVYTFTDENKKIFDDFIEKLTNENTEAIDNQAKVMNDYNEYVRSESLDIDIKKLNLKHINAKFFEENPEEGKRFAAICGDLIFENEA